MDNYYEIPENCPSTSSLLHLFLASYYGDPLTEKTQRKLSKSTFAPPPFRQNAQNPSWQRKFDRKLDKIEKAQEKAGPEEFLYEAIGDLYGWVMDEAFKSDPFIVVDGLLEQKKRELDGEGLATGDWLRFEQIVTSVKELNPNTPKTILFEYVQSHKYTQFEEEIDLLLWMLVAWLEFESLCYGNEIGFLYKKHKNYGNPLATWIPVAESGKLKTSRYYVMDYFLKNTFKIKDRTAERFRGEPQWNCFAQYIDYSPLRIKAVIPYFGHGRLNHTETFLIETRIQFAYFIGWYQLKLFEKGIPAEEIVKSFERIEHVRDIFFTELIYFSEQRNSNLYSSNSSI